MKAPFKKKDRQGLRYKEIKSSKELDRVDDKWIESEVEEYELQHNQHPEQEKD